MTVNRFGALWGNPISFRSLVLSYLFLRSLNVVRPEDMAHGLAKLVDNQANGGFRNSKHVRQCVVTHPCCQLIQLHTYVLSQGDG